MGRYCDICETKLNPPTGAEMTPVRCPDCIAHVDTLPHEYRHDNSSTIVISQLPTDQWYAAIGDNTIADAILDRLMHNAHSLKLNGASMRKKLRQLTQDEHLQ